MSFKSGLHCFRFDLVDYESDTYRDRHGSQHVIFLFDAQGNRFKTSHAAWTSRWAKESGVAKDVLKECISKKVPVIVRGTFESHRSLKDVEFYRDPSQVPAGVDVRNYKDAAAPAPERWFHPNWKGKSVCFLASPAKVSRSTSDKHYLRVTLRYEFRAAEPAQRSADFEILLSFWKGAHAVDIEALLRAEILDGDDQPVLVGGHVARSTVDEIPRFEPSFMIVEGNLIRF
jgi:hypothetical protein